MTYVRRCNAEERKAIIRMSRFYDRKYRGVVDPAGEEPAMGTLEERLDIIIRRLGGRAQLRRVYDVEDFRVAQ
jgi:hypothetical protein